MTKVTTLLPLLGCPKHGRVRPAVRVHRVVSIRDYLCPVCERILWSDRFVVVDEEANMKKAVGI